MSDGSIIYKTGTVPWMQALVKSLYCFQTGTDLAAE